VDRFDTSVFDGVYVTGDVTPTTSTSWSVPQRRRQAGATGRQDETVIELYNTA
jgi:amidophosphoribosyltransferase